MKSLTSTTAEDTLRSLGYRDSEISLYLTALQAGESTPSRFAKLAGIPRTYTYDLLADLAGQGLFTSAIRQNKLHYSPVPPHQLRTIHANRLARLDQVLPYLQQLQEGVGGRPKVRLVEGKEGLSVVINELQSARAIDVFGEDKGWVESFPDWLEHVKAIVRHRIRVREIARRLPETSAYDQLYKPGLQEMRFSRESWGFASNVFIYGDQVVFLTYLPEMHGVVIESRQIAATMRAAFEVLWAQAEVVHTTHLDNISAI